MKAILLPIKNPDNPKSRLSGLMSLAERQELCWAMYCDVSRALAPVREAASIVVVTGFDTARAYALEMGFDVLFEDSQLSESASVDWASRILAGRGFDSVLRLPGDIPLLRTEDVESLLAAEVPSPGALMVPSFDGTGTNALMRAPPELFPSRFGPNSLALHNQEASDAGAACIVVNNPRIALDIDEPADLHMFLALGQGTGTYEIARKQMANRIIK